MPPVPRLPALTPPYQIASFPVAPLSSALNVTRRLLLMSGVALLNALPAGRLNVDAPDPTDARAWSCVVYGNSPASALDGKTTEDEAKASPKPRAAEVVRRILRLLSRCWCECCPDHEEGQPGCGTKTGAVPAQPDADYCPCAEGSQSNFLRIWSGLRHIRQAALPRNWSGTEQLENRRLDRVKDGARAGDYLRIIPRSIWRA